MLQITGAQLRDAMIAANIQTAADHECGICNSWVMFVRDGDRLFFDSNCDCCSYRSELKPYSWNDAADWISAHQQVEARNTLRARFGMLPE